MEDTLSGTDWFHWIADILVAIVGGIVAWISKRISRVERDLTSHQIDVAKQYLTRADHTLSMERIENMFERIMDRLDKKVDK